MMKVEKKPNRERKPSHAVPPASQAAPEKDALTEAAKAIENYKAGEKALAKAVRICESAEAALDVERNRLSARDADQLAAGEILFDAWDNDVPYAAASKALMQARAVVKACRERIKADGEAVVQAHQKFLSDRTAAATKAIESWRAKYWSVVMEAATEAALLQQIFETTIDELKQLPPVETPHDKTTGASPWIQVSKDLEAISNRMKAIQQTAGMYRVQQGFTWDSRDWRAGTLISSDWFEAKALMRLISRGMVVTLVEEKITPLKPLTIQEYERMRAAEKNVTPSEHLPGRPFLPQPKPPDSDWTSGLERDSPSARTAAPWPSPPEGGQ
jgi:hypothetical protein